jgi:hypothetical protein
VSQATGLANAQYNPTVVSLASKDSRTTSLEDRSRKVALTSSQYPKRLESLVQVHVIQSRDHILNTYSDKISDYAENKFARNDVKVWTNTRRAFASRRE